MVERILAFSAICAALGSFAAWYGSSVKKQYASERDFKHMQRNYENLAGNVAALSDLLDDRLDRISLTVIEIKARQDILLTQTRNPKEH